VPAEVQRRMFEPFFITEEERAGEETGWFLRQTVRQILAKPFRIEDFEEAIRDVSTQWVTT